MHLPTLKSIYHLFVVSLVGLNLSQLSLQVFSIAVNLQSPLSPFVSLLSRLQIHETADEFVWHLKDPAVNFTMMGVDFSLLSLVVVNWSI